MMKLREIHDKDGGRWKLCNWVDWQAFVLAALRLRAVLLDRWIIGQIGLRIERL